MSNSNLEDRLKDCPACGNEIPQGKNYCDECQRDVEDLQRKRVGLQVHKTVFFVFLTLTLVFCTVVIWQEGRTYQAQEISSDAFPVVMRRPARSSSFQNGSETPQLEEADSIIYDITKITNKVPIHPREDYLEWMLKFTPEKEEMLTQRWDLAQVFIASRELEGEDNIRAFLLTPREYFVRKHNEGKEYHDTWLHIGHGVTITDPDVVSMMTTSLKVEPHHKVLEIGTGSGYQSAILSNLSNHIFTIEINEPIAIETDQLYEGLEKEYFTIRNIRRKLDDGFYGWEDHYPFDRIIITCAIDHIPPPLLQQLAPDGIIVVPLGPPGRQHIMQITKKVDAETGAIALDRRDVYNGLSVKFIPFRNKENESYSSTEET